MNILELLSFFIIITCSCESKVYMYILTQPNFKQQFQSIQGCLATWLKWCDKFLTLYLRALRISWESLPLYIALFIVLPEQMQTILVASIFKEVLTELPKTFRSLVTSGPTDFQMAKASTCSQTLWIKSWKVH